MKVSKNTLSPAVNDANMAWGCGGWGVRHVLGAEAQDPLPALLHDLLLQHGLQRRVQRLLDLRTHGERVSVTKTP